MNDDVLDRRTISSLRSFGEVPGQLLQEMLGDFLSEAPALMADIDRSIAAKSYAVVARAAHQLAGISGCVGATRLVLAANEVESSSGAPSDQVVAAAKTARTELELAVTAAAGVQSS
jgi:HPt (histidine-containing phosphotransfer) domain-containing protein